MKIFVLLGLVGVTLPFGNGGVIQCRPASPPIPPTPQPLIHLSDTAVCYYIRSLELVTCTVNCESVTCEAVRPPHQNEKMPFGPTPLGEYLLGERVIHNIHGVEWHKLHPLIPGKNTYWHADVHNLISPRNGFGLHEGNPSDGGITVFDRSCWSNLRLLLSFASVSPSAVYGMGNGPFPTNTIGKLFVFP